MDDVTRCAERLRVLAEPTRLAVLRLLLKHPNSAGEIAAALKVEQTLLSHHLALLRSAHLVQVHREGKRRVYRAAPTVCIRDGCDEIELGCCRLRFDDPL